MSVEQVWVDSLVEAGRLAYGMQLSSLRGNRAKRYDDRGLDVYSEAWGRVHACEQARPELQELRFFPRRPLDVDSADPACDPVTLRRAAEQDAALAFRLEVERGVWQRIGRAMSEVVGS